MPEEQALLELETIREIGQKTKQIFTEMHKVIIGQETLIDRLLLQMHPANWTYRSLVYPAVTPCSSGI